MKMFWYSGSTLMTCSPLLISAKRMAPRALPAMVPMPPNNDVPPMITAVTTWKVKEAPPAEGEAVLRRAAPRMPASAGDGAADRVQRHVEAGHPDAVGRGRAAVAASGSDVVAEHGPFQDDVEDQPDDHGVEDEVRDAADVPGADADEGVREAVDVGAAGDDDGDAAGDEERPERGDQGRHAEVDRCGRVGKPDADADRDAGEQRERPGGAVRHEQAGDDRAECVDRADGEVEAATDKDQRRGAGDDEVQGGGAQQLDEVARGEEGAVPGGEHRGEHQDARDESCLLGIAAPLRPVARPGGACGAAAGAPCGRAPGGGLAHGSSSMGWSDTDPVIRPMTSSLVVAVTSRTPATRPSRMTWTRSATSKTKFMSWLTQMTVVPRSRSSRMSLVACAVSRTPRAAVGSSSRTIPAPVRIARAIATIWRWPPESIPISVLTEATVTLCSSRKARDCAVHRLAVDEPAASRELAEEHVGGDVEHLDQGQILEDGGHAGAPGVGGTAERDVVAGDPDLTLVLLVDAADDLDERGLAGAVVAEDGQHLPGVGGQVDAGESGEVAEPLGDAAQLKVGGAGARFGHRVLFQDSSFASARTASRLALVTKVVPVSVVGGTCLPWLTATSRSTAFLAMSQKCWRLVP